MTPLTAPLAGWVATALLAGTATVRAADPAGEPRDDRLAPTAAVPSHPLDGPADTLTLLAAVEAALATHPGRASARAAVDGARAGRTIAGAARFPSLAVEGSFTRFQEPMVVAPLHGFDPTDPPGFDRTLVQGRLGLAWTLFDGGERGARSRAADALLETARAGLDASEAALLAGVAEAFLGTATAREVEAAHAARVRALEAEVARVGRFLAEGRAARVEVLRAEAALSAARADAHAAAADLQVAERELARLTGLPPVRVSASLLAPVSLRPSAAAPAVETREPDVSRSPALAEARGRVAAAEAGRIEASSRRLPRVRAMAGWNEFGAGSGDFTGEWQAGLLLSYPVFTGGERGGTVDRAEAELDRAREERRAVELRASSEADRARAALAEARARSEALEAAVEQYEEVVRIEALTLQAGAGVQRDFLAAQAGLLEARAALARARHGRVLARLALAAVQGELTTSWLESELEGAGRGFGARTMNPGAEP